MFRLPSLIRGMLLFHGWGQRVVCDTSISIYATGSMDTRNGLSYLTLELSDQCFAILFEFLRSQLKRCRRPSGELNRFANAFVRILGSVSL